MENKNILIICSHPDDEILGVGATIEKHKKRGDKVYYLIIGKGRGTFFDNKFDMIPLLDIVKKVEEYIERIKPDIIYTHYEYDLNIDHRITYQAVITACRPCNIYCPKEIYSFEVLSSTEWQPNTFNPNVFVNIENEIKDKIKALRKYKSEMRKFPHSRSIEGVRTLAKYRGMQSGLKFAEAFILMRKIKK